MAGPPWSWPAVPATGRAVSPVKAHEVVAVDTSPEAIEIARRKLPPGAQVRFVEADVFGWEPRVRFDLVFFSFWLSHVPPDRFESFWGLVDRCLSAGGRVVLIDNKWNDGVWPQIAERPRLRAGPHRPQRRRGPQGREDLLRA